MLRVLARNARTPPAGAGGVAGGLDCRAVWTQILRLITVARLLAHGPVTFWHQIPAIETVFRQVS